MDFTAITEAPFIIQAHVACALPAIVLGPIALFRSRRDIWHKIAGRVWVTAMAGLAGTSLFIHEIRMFGLFSPIHILSLVTFVGLFFALRAVFRRDYAAHGRAMRTLYLLALIVAGVFTFGPGRRMSRLFGGDPQLVLIMAALLGAAVFAGIWFAPNLRRATQKSRRIPLFNGDAPR